MTRRVVGEAHAGAPDRVNPDDEHVEQRSVLEREVVGQQDGVLRGHQQVLGEAT